MKNKLPNLAIVTQSYRGDFNECKLLCESIDRYVDKSIAHYIFVNDEDYMLFNDGSISNRHIIKKKSAVLPKYWFNFPLKILGHKYYISPVTIPVREWIIQQICKLGAFDAIGDSVDAIINIDSETVFMRPFDINDIYNIKTGKYLFFKEPFREEPCHEEYCFTSKKILNLSVGIDKLQQFCYMSHPIIFVRDNINKLLCAIKNNGTFFNNWKNILGNTYRFSEYYLYGIFSDYVLNLENHYIIDQHLFPMIDIRNVTDETMLEESIHQIMSNPLCLGVWLQKSKRNASETHYLNYNVIDSIVKKIWVEG
ncbi:MAG: hypothetical protein K2G47_09720 [Muribaculum sp.]|nr:hypothetical protein [Muribaculum sp.]